jgi:microcystin-dependent protein
LQVNNMQILGTALLSFIFTFGGALALYNYLPLSVLDSISVSKPFDDSLGATITTIAGSDTISSSRAVINTNFANLNSDKLEVATTSVGNITALPGLTTAGALATVGTITSGRWNGLAVTSTYGGTGTTTFPAFHVLIASSTGAGIMSVSGLGSSGQFLTSQGAGTAPLWTTSAVDLAIAYTWTGQHAFNVVATTSFANATTTFVDMSQHGEYGGIAPVGSIIAYASTTPPSGWLLCNGSAVNRVKHRRLFQVIGTTYGTGDGSTTFTLPDLRNRKIAMASTTANIAQTGGEANHTLSIAEMPSHDHSYTYSAGATPSGAGSNSAVNEAATTGATGGGGAHNVLDPYMALFYIIRY